MTVCSVVHNGLVCVCYECTSIRIYVCISNNVLFCHLYHLFQFYFLTAVAVIMLYRTNFPTAVSRSVVVDLYTDVAFV